MHSVAGLAPDGCTKNGAAGCGENACAWKLRVCHRAKVVDDGKFFGVHTSGLFRQQLFAGRALALLHDLGSSYRIALYKARFSASRGSVQRRGNSD